MATINSVKFVMSRTSNRTGFNLVCNVRAPATGDENAALSSGTLLGTSDSVLVDTLAVNGSGTTEVTFTFSTPVEITEIGFYGFQIVCDGSDYDMAGVYAYLASSFTLPGTVDSEKGQYYLAGWNVLSEAFSYVTDCDGCDNNSATGIKAGTWQEASKWSSKANSGLGNRVYLLPGASKATDPTPEDDAGPGYDFSTPTLSWTNNGGDDATFDVYGGGAGTWVKLVEGLTEATVTLDSTDKAAMRCGEGASCTWRVDTIVGATTYTGDVWTFDPRPSAPTNPTPTNAASDVNFASTAFSWDAATGDVDTYDVIVNSNTLSLAQAGTSYTLNTDAFDWGDSVTWKIDATNYFGTTSSSEWTFDVITKDVIRISYELIDGGSGFGPYGGGVEGVDWWWTGLNNIIVVRRLIVAAKDRIYYETL